MTLHTLYMSPSGTTKQVVTAIEEGVGLPSQHYDLMENKIWDLSIPSEDVALVAVPVFAGRVPALASAQLDFVQGHQTPAIICVVYGNRDFDDALLELQDLLEKRGFCVMGAITCVGQHSIYPQVATNRPDEKDIRRIYDFGRKCQELLLEFTPETWEPLPLPGSYPYRSYGNIPIKPKGNNRCTECGLCIAVCPTGAIDQSNPRLTDKNACITCTACISVCPEKARTLDCLLYRLGGRKFIKDNQTRKAIHVFI